MNSTKAITHIPGWLDALQAGDKLQHEHNTYSFVPLVYRAMRLRCDALSSVPVKFYRGETELEWPYDTSLSSLLWRTEASLCLTGGAYWLKEGMNVVKNIQWLNPYSMSVDYDMSNNSFSFMQQIGSYSRQWGEDDIVYFREFDPIQDVEPGVAPAQVALQDAQEMHYMTRFAAKFFEHGAMPVTVLGLEQVSDAELKRVESVFTRMMTSVRNAFKILAVRANSINIQPITPPLKDLAMPDLYSQTKKNIANAFGVPVTMMEDPSANRATAGVHHFSFWSETIRPRGMLYEEVINKQLLTAGDITMKFAFDELDVFQEDEAQRSSSLLNLVNARIPADVAVEILGFDLTDEQLARIAEAQETRDEQREQIIDNTSDKQNEQVREDEEEDAAKLWRDELLRWRKNALTRLHKGQNPAKFFKSDIIPPDIAARVYTMLRMCKSVEDIEAVFDALLQGDTFDKYYELEQPDIGELVDAIRDATNYLKDNNDAA